MLFRSLVEEDVQVDIQGYDVDGDIVKAARTNAQSAGVDHMIHFQQRPVSALSHPKKYGFIISNPPYGERIEEKENLPACARRTRHRRHVRLVLQQPRGGQRQQRQLDRRGEAAGIGHAPRRTDAVAVQFGKSVDEEIGRAHV